MNISIIVDSPRRDLRGLLYLTSKLLTNHVVFITPNYHLFEVFLINPDLIIFHNCRPMHQKYLALAKKLNISVGILDTEGAQLGPNNKDLIYFSDVVNDSAKYFDLYFLWGKLQLESIMNNKKFDLRNKTKFHITNNPRFDLYKDENKIYLKKIKKNKKIILFNTNFAWVAPRYTSIKQEIDVGIKEFYKNKNEAVNKLKHENKLFYNFLSTIKLVSNEFPNYKIIINPHPYESNLIYKKLLKNYSNVLIIRDVFLPDLFNNSDYIISYNCQTCVDSFLFGKNTISINYIDDTKSLSEFYRDICININSEKELLSHINGNNNQAEKSRNEKIHHLFEDINSSNKIKDIINEFFVKNDKNKTFGIKDKLNILKLIFFNDDISGYRYKLKLFIISGLLKLLIFIFIGSDKFFSIKTFFLNNYRAKYIDKEFISVYTNNFISKKATITKSKSTFFNFIFKKLSTFRFEIKS